MVEIKYIKSDSGLDNCFYFAFPWRDYIQSTFFEQHENGDGAVLYFFISLLNKFSIFDCQREHYHQMIWSTHYDCVYDNIPFSMVYDNDYDIVSFAGFWSNEEKIKVAERIKNLIETEGINIEFPTRKE